MTQPDDKGNPKWWQILLWIEAVALAIALAMPITPSKTGSNWSPAEFLFGTPGYLAEVALWFVATNVLIGLLAAGIAIHLYVKNR